MVFGKRVKFIDDHKPVPSYVHMRDEGELWSLNYEGKLFCCWKCGSTLHIGDKCRDQSRMFEETFEGVGEIEPDFVKPIWAAVVRSGRAEDQSYAESVKEMEQRIREEKKKNMKDLKDQKKGGGGERKGEKKGRR